VFKGLMQFREIISGVERGPQTPRRGSS